MIKSIEIQLSKEVFIKLRKRIVRSKLLITIRKRSNYELSQAL
ncbi:MAG: hypothetical protein ACOX2N_09045 [Peptococcia bacterium]